MNPTNISWTDFTSNPIHATLPNNLLDEGWMCTKISEGCDHCYAEAVNHRYGIKYDYTAENARKVTWLLNNIEILSWHKRKKPAKIFVCSMTDIFLEQIPDTFRDLIFYQMSQVPRHTFQVLTKRPWVADAYFQSHEIPKNMWLGTSVESKRWTIRIDYLRKINAPVRFLSCEPLLESLGTLNLDGITWVIVGAESGIKRRPFNEEWAKEIWDQCRERGIAFWYKQGSDKYPGRHEELDGVEVQEFPVMNNGK